MVDDEVIRVFFNSGLVHEINRVVVEHPSFYSLSGGLLKLQRVKIVAVVYSKSEGNAGFDVSFRCVPEIERHAHEIVVPQGMLEMLLQDFKLGDPKDGIGCKAMNYFMNSAPLSEGISIDVPSAASSYYFDFG